LAERILPDTNEWYIYYILRPTVVGPFEHDLIGIISDDDPLFLDYRVLASRYCTGAMGALNKVFADYHIREHGWRIITNHLEAEFWKHFIMTEITETQG
jgi:hypothetical protein